MPLFLIERNFAEIVQTDPETMALIKEVNDEIGIQWLFSFLSADRRKTYCLYEATDAEAIRVAARRLGGPADTIVEVGAEVGAYGRGDGAAARARRVISSGIVGELGCFDPPSSSAASAGSSRSPPAAVRTGDR